MFPLVVARLEGHISVVLLIGISVRSRPGAVMRNCLLRVFASLDLPNFCLVFQGSHRGDGRHIYICAGPRLSQPMWLDIEVPCRRVCNRIVLVFC